MTKFNKAKIYTGINDLTLLELLLYSILCANADVNNEVYSPLEYLTEFLKSPSALKFRNLIKKGYIIKLKKDTYKLLKTHNTKSVTISNNKYRDSEAVVYSLLKLYKEVYAEDLANILNCHQSTITKILHKITEAKYKAEWLNNGTSGKVYKWYMGNTPSKEHPARPEFILYYSDLVEHLDSLDDKLIYSYLYSINKLNIDASINELNNILAKKIKKININLNDTIPNSRPIKIPLYTEYKGVNLCILSLVSDYRLKGMNAIWSLNAFTNMFNINTKDAFKYCRLLIKKKKLSKPSKKEIEAWKEYTGSDSDFRTAVTVTKDQNIILKYCSLLSPRSS